MADNPKSRWNSVLETLGLPVSEPAPSAPAEPAEPAAEATTAPSPMPPAPPAPRPTRPEREKPAPRPKAARPSGNWSSIASSLGLEVPPEPVREPEPEPPVAPSRSPEPAPEFPSTPLGFERSPLDEIRGPKARDVDVFGLGKSDEDDDPGQVLDYIDEGEADLAISSEEVEGLEIIGQARPPQREADRPERRGYEEGARREEGDREGGRRRRRRGRGRGGRREEESGARPVEGRREEGRREEGRKEEARREEPGRRDEGRREESRRDTGRRDERSGPPVREGRYAPPPAEDDDDLMVLDADFSPIEDDDLLLEDEGSPLEDLPPEPAARRPEPRETEGRGRGRRGGRGRPARDRDSGEGRRDRERPPAPQSEERFDEPAGVELEEHEDELGEEGGHPSHKKIPTWEEAVGVLVDSNLASRAKSPDRDRGSRGGRGRGRGGR